MNDTVEPAGQDAVPVIRLGKRRWRAFAVTLDSIVAIIAALPLLIYFDVWNTIVSGSEIPTRLTLLFAVGGWVAFALLNYRLLDSRGQTIGKWCCDLSIVGLDGERKSAVYLLTRRFLPIWLVGLIPFIGNLILTVDSLLIFGKDKRCLHDRIAGTRVLSLKPVDPTRPGVTAP